MTKIEAAEFLLKAWDEILSKIPGKQWTIREFSKTTKSGNKCCAIGHYVRLTSDDPLNYTISNCSDNQYSNPNPESRKLREASMVFFKYERISVNHHMIIVDIAAINNGFHPMYAQDNPKARVKAFMNDVKDFLIEQQLNKIEDEQNRAIRENSELAYTGVH